MTAKLAFAGFHYSTAEGDDPKSGRGTLRAMLGSGGRHERPHTYFHPDPNQDVSQWDLRRDAIEVSETTTLNHKVSNATPTDQIL